MSNSFENQELNVPQEASDEAAATVDAATNKRRRFLAQAGIAGVGVLGASQIAANAQAFRNPGRIIRRPGTPATPANPNGPGIPATPAVPATPAAPNIDIDVLNFALNLEYLEAEFYTRAAFGRGIVVGVSGTGTQGVVVSPTGDPASLRVPFRSPQVQQYALELAADEETHVTFLRNAISSLGGTPVARPNIDLGTSFTAAARAAGIIGATDTFNPYADDISFLLGSFIFEDVGVTGYRGGAPLLTNKTVVSAAAGILGTEAYHAGLIRTAILNTGNAFAIDAARKISDLRDAVDGADDRDQPIVVNGIANIAPTDGNSLVFDRTTSQVLSIVYLGGPVGVGGGFFPNGTNGRFR